MFGTLTTFPGGLFNDFDRLQRELDRLFVDSVSGPASIRAVARGSFPAVNVGVTPEAVEVYAFMPGVDPKSLDLSMQDGLLTLAGERTTEAPVDEAKGSVYQKERFSGPFKRVVSLSEDIDPDKIEARYENGVLHVRALKKAAVKPKQIEIK